MFLAVAAYQQLAEACDYPLHLGITEAGGLRTGTVKSSIGMGTLLWAGIGDTIRVSLSADPVEEVRVGFDMLKSLGLRHRGVNIISCPSCARQEFNVIQTVEALEERLAHITTPMTLSIIGCVVNGPGEARETDIGFTGGGNGTHQVYVAGVPRSSAEGRQHRRPSRRAGREEGGGDRGREGGRGRSRRRRQSRRSSATRSFRSLSDAAARCAARTISCPTSMRAPSRTWSRPRATWRERYGYLEMATPIFEFTEVFARTLGETSDVVTKEMYTFDDRGGEQLTLRPENTAGIAAPSSPTASPSTCR